MFENTDKIDRDKTNVWHDKKGLKKAELEGLKRRVEFEQGKVREYDRINDIVDTIAT